jgi:hypothetical protein
MGQTKELLMEYLNEEGDIATRLNEDALSKVTIGELDLLAKEHPNLSFWFSNGKLHVGRCGFYD